MEIATSTKLTVSENLASQGEAILRVQHLSNTEATQSALHKVKRFFRTAFKNKTKKENLIITSQADILYMHTKRHIAPWGWWKFFAGSTPQCFWVTRDTRPGMDCLSPITTAVFCWATETKHPTSHYIDAALDRSTESNHQTSSGTKWQITPLSCLSLSLFHSLCPLSFPLPFLICLSLFSLSTSSLFSVLSPPWSLISFLTPLLLCCLSFCLSLCFYLSAPLFFLLTFIFPISLNLSLSVRHILSSRRTWQLGRCREWTMTYSPLSTPRVGQTEARPWAGISVTVTMRSGRLTVQFGKLAGFTALVQQGQSTERTRWTLNWGQGWRHPTSTFQKNVSFTDTETLTKQHNMVFITSLYYQWVNGSRCIVILSFSVF